MRDVYPNGHNYTSASHYAKDVISSDEVLLRKKSFLGFLANAR